MRSGNKKKMFTTDKFPYKAKGQGRIGVLQVKGVTYPAGNLIKNRFCQSQKSNKPKPLSNGSRKLFI